MSKVVTENLSESHRIRKQIDEIIALEKINKNEFIRRVMDFYVKNKVLLISEDKISEGYKEMGDINLSLAEESLSCDSECVQKYERYLLSSDINYKKGADLPFAEHKQYSEKYRHDQAW